MKLKTKTKRRDLVFMKHNSNKRPNPTQTRYVSSIHTSTNLSTHFFFQSTTQPNPHNQLSKPILLMFEPTQLSFKYSKSKQPCTTITLDQDSTQNPIGPHQLICFIPRPNYTNPTQFT